MGTLASHCTSLFDKSIKVLQEQKAISILSNKNNCSYDFCPQITQHTYILNSSLLFLSRWSLFPLMCLKRNIMLRVRFHDQLKRQRHPWHKVLPFVPPWDSGSFCLTLCLLRPLYKWVLVQTHWSNWKLVLHEFVSWYNSQLKKGTWICVWCWVRESWSAGLFLSMAAQP